MKNKEHVLCSEGFKKFFDSLIELNIYDIDKMVEKILQAIPYVSDELHLGKVECRLEAPATLYEPKGKTGFQEVYLSDAGYDTEQPQVNEFVTGEKGTVQITSYPEAGYVWSQEEKNAITFLAQNVYVFAGRVRLMGFMKKAAITDNLTGVANTVGLMQFGGRLQAKGILGEYAACYCNIKNFKYVNKKVGARRGDQVLIEYAQGIMRWLHSDEIFTRLGGDNFFALVRKERLDHFLQFISKFKVRIRQQGEMQEYAILSRAGIYFPSKEDNMSDVMNASTAALHVARRSAKEDIVWFNPQMLERAMHRKEISLLFPKALKNEEFVVFYQPKVSLNDNKLCGCEALVRWERDGAIISPMEFVPVLEEEGSICDLDFYVFETVCRDIRQWLDQGLEPVRVSVNFSKIHLHNKVLAEDILSIINKYGIASKYIEIELTEMSGYEDYEALAAFVDMMKDKGVNTSIDDFGTGYSSLNLLKDLKVDIIKLDKSFLDDIMKTQNHKDEIVIKNIVNMVRELQMEVIAEGVETTEQVDFLKNIKCCMAQGFLFDRPLSHDDFEKRLRNRTYEVCSKE